MHSKKIEDMTFEELVKNAALEIHSALLESGGKGLKGSLHVWMGQAIYWSNLQDKKSGEENEKRKR